MSVTLVRRSEYVLDTSVDSTSHFSTFHTQPQVWTAVLLLIVLYMGAIFVVQMVMEDVSVFGEDEENVRRGLPGCIGERSINGSIADLMDFRLFLHVLGSL